jgi:hypothetical protein
VQTLTYGFKLPSTGDSGDALWTALEDNITRVDGHSHNGTDSPSLTAQSVVASTATITNVGWVASGATGHYRQSVTLPAGFDFDTVQIGFRTTGGAQIHPTVERISDTQYYVYTTDNTISYVAVYGG